MMNIPAVHLSERAGKLRQTEKDGAGPDALNAHCGAHCGAHCAILRPQLPSGQRSLLLQQQLR